MDIIKLGKSTPTKNLGKYKCSCGLIVRLYEEDIFTDNFCTDTWKCPCCDKVNEFNKNTQIGLHKYKFLLQIFLFFICLVFLMTLGVISAVRHDNELERRYAYSFEIFLEDSVWETVYTNDEDIIYLKTLPAGYEYVDWAERIYYAQESQPIRNVRKT